MWGTAEERFVRHVLFQESIPFLKSKPALPTRSLKPLRAAARFTSSLRLHHPCKTIELWYPSFGLQAIDCDLGCLVDATAASQWRIVEIQLLASVGWKWGCQPFSCPCSKCEARPKRGLCDMLSKEPWNLILHSQVEVPESGSTLHQLVELASSLQNIELWYPSFGLQAIDCDLGCLVDATAAIQWRIVEIQLLASVG